VIVAYFFGPPVVIQIIAYTVINLQFFACIFYFSSKSACVVYNEYPTVHLSTWSLGHLWGIRLL